MEADRLPTRDARTPKPRGGNLANCAAATIMRPYLMMFHGHTAARDHTPRVQPRHTHRRRATPGRHSPATSNTYYLPRYVPRRVLPRARNKPALFLRVIENFRQTRTANLAWYVATVGRYIASSLRLRSAHRSKCSASSHVSSGFDMKIRLSLAGEEVPGERAFVSFLLYSESLGVFVVLGFGIG